MLFHFTNGKTFAVEKIPCPSYRPIASSHVAKKMSKTPTSRLLGLKGYTKGLIDIQTDEIWFEARDTGNTPATPCSRKLLHYVRVALNKG